MRRKVEQYIRKYHMTEAGERVCIGLSGGADSVCLFLLLEELRHSLGFTLEAVHVNHCLRGAEADEDEEFVRNLCAACGVPFLTSLMSQFTPFYKAAGHGLGRRITTYEYRQVVDEAVRLGLTDGYMQEKSSAREEYTPPFDLEGV